MEKRGFLFIAGVFCITLMAGLLPALAEVTKDAATIPVLEVKFDDTFFSQGESVAPNHRSKGLPASVFEGAPDGAALISTNAGRSSWSAVTGVFGGANISGFGGEAVEIEYRADAGLTGLTFKTGLRNSSPVVLTNSAPCDGTWKTLRFPVADLLKDKELYSLICSVDNPSGSAASVNIRRFRLWREPINTRLDADAILSVPPPHTFGVSNINGAMTFVQDGIPFTGAGYTDILMGTAGNKAEFDAKYGQFLGGSGLDFHRVPVSLGFDMTGHRPACWLGPDHFDFSRFDAILAMMTRHNPSARIILQCSMGVAPWWVRMNPDLHDPWFIPRSGVPVNGYARLSFDAPDYLSDEWRALIRDALRQLIAHVQSGPYAGHVIGYQLMDAAGYDNQFSFIPRTPKALERWRNFLREKYGTREALAEAWRDPQVTFENAQPLQLNGMPVEPDSAAHASPLAYQEPDPPGLLIEPAKHARLMDTMDYMRQAEETYVLDFCRTVKEATHNRRLAGTQHGNLLAAQHKREPVYRWSWKKPLQALLESPDLDFFEQWPAYHGRGKRGDSGEEIFGDIPVLPPQGAAACGKLFALENDYRYDGRPPRPPETDREILSYQRRIFISSLVWGMSPYLWDMGWIDRLVQVLPEWRVQESIFQRAFTLNRSTGAEVAFVVDPDYTRFSGYDTRYQKGDVTAGLELISKASSDWCRSGVPFDMIFLDQLTNAAPYKVYVFFLTLGLSDAQRTEIQNVTRRNGIVSIFLWADGYINDDTGAASAANISALTGMTVTKVTNTNQTWVMTPESWFTNTMGLAAGHKLGVLPLSGNYAARSLSAIFDPSFAVTTNATTKAIAKYDSGGLVGMAVQSNATYQVIYSGSQMIGLPVIRYACRQAGVFSYTEDREQLLYIGNSFIGIHAAKTNAMTLTLKLPAAAPLYDIYNDIEHPAATSFSVPLTFKDNVLFFRGTRAEWRSGLTNSMVAKAINECRLLNFTVVGCATNRTSTYRLVDAPTGATINATNGVFTWTPPATAGSYTTNITVRVSYGTDGLYEEQVFAVTVKKENAQPGKGATP
jgi:hypothetical protein